MAVNAETGIIFSRVVVSKSGEAVTPAMALDVYGIYPDIAFLRDDGWSLAAPMQFEEIAYEMWKDKWTHFMRKPNRVWSDIENYL